MSVFICEDLEGIKVDPKSNFLFIILLEFGMSISSTSHFPDGAIKIALVDTKDLFFEIDEPIKIKYIHNKK